MAIHTSMHAQRILWTEEPGGLHTVHRVTELDRTEVTEGAHTHTHNTNKNKVTNGVLKAFPIIPPGELSVHHSSEICA